MNDRQTYSALREWRDHILAPATVMVVAAVSLILTIIVPFGIDHVLGPVGRFGYWMLVTVSTYGAGALINNLLGRIWRNRMPIWLLIALCCAATGIAISVMVTGINFVTLGYLPASKDLPLYLGNIFAIAAIVAAVFQILTRDTGTLPSAPPRILERLAFEKRGTLFALSVEDHYVRVITSKGGDVILMRLRDAMLETGDAAGLQIHRSHWIALAAVKSVKRDGDRALITLTNGDVVPASRRYIPAMKEAGLLPR